MNYLIVINYQLPSTHKRLTLLDLQTYQVLYTTYCAHGHGKQPEGSPIQFSNEIDSNYSSLGVYRFGEPYIGKYGQSYRLHGLEPTNSNALIRNIVFHAHTEVHEAAALSGNLWRSAGCPVVSHEALQYLEPYLIPITLLYILGNQPQILSLQ